MKLTHQSLRLVRMLEQLQLELEEERTLTLAELVEVWRREHVDSGRLKPSTVTSYRRQGATIVRILGHEPVTEIGPKHMGMLQTDPEIGGPVERGYTCNTLLTILSWGRQNGHFYGPDHLKGWPRYSSPAKSRVLTDEEMLGIWSALDTVAAPSSVAGLIRCLLLTGARRCEFRLLRWEHIHASWSCAMVGIVKRKHRRLHLPALARQIIEEQPRVGPYVFRSTKSPGRPVSDSTVTCWWNRACKAATVEDATPHAARHTMITRLMRAGYHPAIVRDLAGHSSMAMTFRYTHASNDELQAASEVLTDVFRQAE